MTPVDYKSRYENLKVYFDDGRTPEPVRVNQYRLGGQNLNKPELDKFLAKLQEKRGELPALRVELSGGQIVILDKAVNTMSRVMKVLNKGEKQIVFAAPRGNVAGTLATQDIVDNNMKLKSSSYRELEWGVMARYCFKGKGSPEHCQVVLRLASDWGLAPKGLQDYADRCLGLDCNGFVGNFLWHGKPGVQWYELGVANQHLGPDATINGFFRKPRLTNWDKLDPGKTYVIGKVDGAGNVIPGGGSVQNAGHIAITQRGDRVVSADKDSKGKFDVKVVESTASANPGLTTTYYNFTVQQGAIFTLKSRGFVRNPPFKAVICEV